MLFPFFFDISTFFCHAKEIENPKGYLTHMKTESTTYEDGKKQHMANLLEHSTGGSGLLFFLAAELGTVMSPNGQEGLDPLPYFQVV